jgi:hypothetical protein
MDVSFEFIDCLANVLLPCLFVPEPNQAVTKKIHGLFPRYPRILRRKYDKINSCELGYKNDRLTIYILKRAAFMVVLRER